MTPRKAKSERLHSTSALASALAALQARAVSMHLQFVEQGDLFRALRGGLSLTASRRKVERDSRRVEPTAPKRCGQRETGAESYNPLQASPAHHH